MSSPSCTEGWESGVWTQVGAVRAPPPRCKVRECTFRPQITTRAKDVLRSRPGLSMDSATERTSTEAISNQALCGHELR